MRLLGTREIEVEDHLMKHILKLSCLAAAGLWMGTPAQAAVGFSLKGGLNFNSMSVTNSDGTSNDNFYSRGVGYMAGVGLDYDLGPVGIIADVFYARRSLKLASGAGADAGSSLKSNNLYIPVQARFSVMPMLQLSAGAYYSTMLGNGRLVPPSGPSVEVAFESEMRSDIGLVGGVGVAIPVGVSSMTLEARYNWGLKNQAPAPLGDAAIRSRSMDLLAGFKF
jgi:hypothetical protein